jgi:hypothetical protein
VQISHVALALALAACAPTVDGPAERQRALDREDGARLAAQISALPGVVRAEAVIRRAVRDPLGPRAAAPATPAAPAPAAAASAVVAVDDRADRAAITEAARTLARALAPEAAPAIVVEVAAIRPRLAQVGPFTVEAASRGPLKAALAAALALIAALAGWIGWTRLGRASPRRSSAAAPPDRLGQRRGRSVQ